MGEIENHWRLGNTVIYIKICNEYRPESCWVSTLLGGMVRQYSCTVITFSQWIPFPSVLCHSLKFSSIKGVCGPPVPEPGQSATLGHHISEESLTHFCYLQPKWLQMVLQPYLEASPLSPSSWIKAPCTHEQWLQLQAPVGPRDIFQAQENPDRFVMPKACWHTLISFALQLTCQILEKY